MKQIVFQVNKILYGTASLKKKLAVSLTLRHHWKKH